MVFKDDIITRINADFGNSAIKANKKLNGDTNYKRLRDFNKPFDECLYDVKE